MSDIYEDYITQGSTISRDFYNMYVGDEIARGVYRIVHKNLVDPESVFKFEVPGTSHENCIEWEIWQMVKYYPSIKKWFAPCLHISPCGTVLVQARVKEAPDSKFPPKVPRCFSDFKRKNWGLYKGRLVCVDYGAHSTIIMSEGIANCDTLKCARWWDHS